MKELKLNYLKFILRFKVLKKFKHFLYRTSHFSLQKKAEYFGHNTWYHLLHTLSKPLHAHTYARFPLPDILPTHRCLQQQQGTAKEVMRLLCAEPASGLISLRRKHTCAGYFEYKTKGGVREGGELRKVT